MQAHRPPTNRLLRKLPIRRIKVNNLNIVETRPTAANRDYTCAAIDMQLTIPRNAQSFDNVIIGNF